MAGPLWKSQTVGVEPQEFLCKNPDRGYRITLNPGVAYSLRAFYELVGDLIEGAWERFVRNVNANKVDNAPDLGTFLFGHEPAGLEVYRPMLMEVQRGTCLCCKPLSQQADGTPPISGTTSS